MNTDFKNNKRLGKAGLIIYDGSCGACSLFVGERKEFFEKYGFTVAPLQEEWIPGLTGIDKENLLESIHLLTTDGKILRGADFFHYVSSKVWWLTPVHLALKVPFLKRLFSKFYDFIAKRRRKISKVCGLQSRAKYSL